MKVNSASGRMSDKPKELGHLRVFATSDDPDHPSWIVEHHESLEGDRRPEEHRFTDGHEMLAHIGEHSGVPQEEDKERAARQYPDFEIPADKKTR